MSTVPFAIDPTTGVVNVSRPLDISESEQWILNVEVVDGLWKAVVSDSIAKSKRCKNVCIYVCVCSIVGRQNEMLIKHLREFRFQCNI